VEITIKPSSNVCCFERKIVDGVCQGCGSVQCCHLCKKHDTCKIACPNPMEHCQFCAWFLDEPECKEFEFR
jgi:hypothetical protein